MGRDGVGARGGTAGCDRRDRHLGEGLMPHSQRWAHPQRPLREGDRDASARRCQDSVERAGSTAVWGRGTLHAHGKKILESEDPQVLRRSCNGVGE